MRTYVSMAHRLIYLGMPATRAVMHVVKGYGLTMREMEQLYDAVAARG